MVDARNCSLTLGCPALSRIYGGTLVVRPAEALLPSSSPCFLRMGTEQIGQISNLVPSVHAVDFHVPVFYN